MQKTVEYLILLSSESHKNKKPHLSRTKKNIAILLKAFATLDLKYKLPYWTNLKEQLIQQILLPKARKLIWSRSLSKRFLAVECFQLRLKPEDQKYIIQLIQDKILLISLSAAFIALKQPTDQTINTIIDHYSKGRHLQQSLLLDTVKSSHPDAEKIITTRLESETDLFTKVFCYQLLRHLSSSHKIIPVLLQDLKSTNIPLKSAALRYYASCSDCDLNFLRNFCSDPEWKIRVVTIQLLSQKKDLASIDKIALLLRDKEWWVRINAANALVKMGEAGIKILQNQNPDVDNYAYQVSQEVLLTHVFKRKLV